MAISLALSFIAIASGTLLTYTYDEDAPLASRLCSGACIGFGALGLTGFVLASFLGLTIVTLALTGTVLATPFLLLINEARRAKVGCRGRLHTDHGTSTAVCCSNQCSAEVRKGEYNA